jgi:signal transduction histidine kinase
MLTEEKMLIFDEEITDDRFFDLAVLHFNEVMRWQAGQTLHSWAERFLDEIVPFLGALQATLYRINTDNEAELTAAFAPGDLSALQQIVPLGEGTVGQCALSQVPLIHKSKDAYFLPYSTLISLRISAVITYPLIYHEQICGVIELLFCKEPHPRAVELLKRLNLNIAANLSILLKENELKKQNAELERAMEELRVTQSQLVQSEKMSSIGQLTAGIAHEINNPINFVYAGVGALKNTITDLFEILDVFDTFDNDFDKDKYQKTLAHINKLKKDLMYRELREDLVSIVADIKEGANRTAEIVKGLRNFSRNDDEVLKAAKISELIDSTLILLKSQLKNRIQIQLNYDPNLDAINCFPGKLGQVFMNLIVNAIQAIPEGEGFIYISTENTPEFALVRIRDTGTGMPEEVKKRIFEPFFTTKDVGSGTGLGLSITYAIIVDKHKGNVEVNSKAGEGTEFVLKIPKNL